MSNLLSTEDMARKIGVSVRRLQNWDEREYLQPESKDPKRRRYSTDQVRMATVCSRLVTSAIGGRGIRSRQLHAVLKKLPPVIDRRWFAFDHHPLRLLLSTDDPVTFAESVCKYSQRVILVDLGGVE